MGLENVPLRGKGCYEKLSRKVTLPTILGDPMQQYLTTIAKVPVGPGSKMWTVQLKGDQIQHQWDRQELRDGILEHSFALQEGIFQKDQVTVRINGGEATADSDSKGDTGEEVSSLCGASQIAGMSLREVYLEGWCLCYIH